MSRPRLPAGYSHVGFDEIDSTNEEAKRRANSGERGPLWISASSQTAGRGRRGREWVSPVGNLMATLLLSPGTSTQHAASLSFVAALAVHEAVSPWVGPETVRVKWPNDVLINGRKTSGILLESASTSDATKLPWLAVGIGINLVSAPTVANYPATFVNDHGKAPDALEALSVLASAWDRHYRIWQSEGFEPIRKAWLSVAAGLGQPIEVRLAQDSMTGTFETLMPDGALQLKLPSGEARAVTAGEVFFPQSRG
jgi:BirA family biotin operon repressor/biotin-[acetyl-CoA-carboxylase] ligase